MEDIQDLPLFLPPILLTFQPSNLSIQSFSLSSSHFPHRSRRIDKSVGLRLGFVNPSRAKGRKNCEVLSLSFFLVHFLWLELLFFLLLIIVGPVWFTSTSDAAFDGEFIGARAFAMGGAFTAIADESDGLLVNPASISNLPAQQLSATMAILHVGLSDDTSITQQLISYANSQPTRGALGLLWKRLSVSHLYSENYVVAGISKSYELGTETKHRLSLGASTKLLNWDTGPTVGANGTIVEDLPGRSRLSFDAGLIFRPSPNIPIALSLQNLNTPNIASTHSRLKENLPLQTTLGIGILGQKSTWGMDLVFKGNQIDVKVGIEQKFDDGNLLLRGGFRLENLAWGTNLTLGGGYRPSESVRIDYGFVYPIGGIEGTYGSHRFSVVYDF